MWQVPNGAILLSTPVKASIERIAFDPVYWENLKSDLLRYYFEHFLKFASADFHNTAESH